VSDTFAQRNWSHFERLAFELTKECFGITPTKVVQTQESKDGGFDAVFIHELGRLGKTAIAYETLMEAKLRSSGGTLGLRAFAATMIIAFNGRTQCLIVVTNREFSPQALEAARDFQWKSRLQVILVSQKTLSAWIRPRFARLKRRYPRELLADLMLPNPDDENYEEVEILGGQVAGTEPPARIAFGRRPDGTLAKGEIVLMPPTQDTESSGAVIGRARRKVVRDLAEALNGETGCALVTGEAGAGKSYVVRASLAALSCERRCLGLIDLAQTSTSRQLFLATTAQLLGLEIAEIAQQFTTIDAKQVFSTACGAQIPEEVCDAVLSVLTSTSPTLGDIDQIHLTKYLSFIAGGGRAGGRLLVFHNLDKAAVEVLEFLHAIVPTLTTRDVSVLLELAVGGNAQLVGASQWRAYVELFERASTIGRFTVPALDLEGGIELLLEQMPGLGAERARFICERVGNRPLFLFHAALWLKQHQVVAERAQDAHLIEQPEIFFEGLRPEASVSILDRHIDIWRREIELPYADAITAATLLNGRLPVAAAQLLTPGRVNVETMLDALVATGLFVTEPRLEGVRTSHSLLLERMIAIENGEVPGYTARRFERQRVASNLLKGIETYTVPGGIRDLYRSALLAACERWPEVWESAQRAGHTLASEHQLALTAEAFLRAFKAAEMLVSEGDAEGAWRRIYSLIHLLQVESGRYRLGLEENILRLERLTISLRTTRLPAEGTDGIEKVTDEELRLRGRYLNWRAAFTREEFDKALPIAQDLFDRVCTLGEIDQKLAGQAVAALGITLKAVEQTDESKRIFELGVACFPKSAYCQMEQWSNLAALALRTNPTQSLRHYRRILAELSESIPLLPRVHLEADIAMALFLAHRLEEAASQAALAINMADANGIPAEAARGRNILGCVYWREERIDDAISLLDRAVLDAERSYMERFLWRFRVNLASAACEAEQLSIALANSRWAEERLLKARASRLAQLGGSPTHITSRWYVALLSIGLTYSRCKATSDSKRLTQMLSALPLFRQHLAELKQGGFPAEVFANTTHRQGDHIMITG
jgi:tetratricopeptide (TPR) repeat protein